VQISATLFIFMRELRYHRQLSWKEQVLDVAGQFRLVPADSPWRKAAAEAPNL
jgi:hypothetical protein